MADRYWVGGPGTWSTVLTTNWSAASALSFTASCTGTVLTTVGSPALVVGMTVRTATNVSLGTIVSGAVNSWVVSIGGTAASQTMKAATVGASVPTAADSVFFDANSSGTTAYTVTLTGALTCLDFNGSALTPSFVNGTAPTVAISGSMFLTSTTVWTSTGAITFNSSTAGRTISTNNVLISAIINLSNLNGSWTLGSNFRTSTTFNLITGTFSTNNFSLTINNFGLNSGQVKTLSLGSSIVNITTSFTNANAGTTFNAGTSTINFTGTSCTITTPSAGFTFNNVNFTSTAAVALTIDTGVYNTVTFTGRTSLGTSDVFLSGDVTINSLVVNASSGAPYRIFFLSSTTDIQRTINCASVSALIDVDFRDIVVVGAAAPFTGTRLGDCLNNSGITFPAAKNVYYRNSGSSNWAVAGSGSWTSGFSITASCSGTALTTTGSPPLVVGQTILSSTGVSLGTISSGSGNNWVVSVGGTYASQAMLALGTADSNQFPLAQDTAIFAAGTFPANATTTTINSDYNVGTIDMSRRVSNTMTLAFGTTVTNFYGNFINTNRITISGASADMIFVGRTIQTINSPSSGTFPGFEIDGASTILQLLGNISCGNSVFRKGTLDLQSYQLTLSGLVAGGTDNRLIQFGTGNIVFNLNIGSVSLNGTNFTTTGSRNVSFTSSGSPNTANMGSFIESSALNVSFGPGGYSFSGSVNNLTSTVTTFNSIAAVTVFGNLSVSASTTITALTSITFAATSGAKTITTNGKTLDGAVTFGPAAGSAATWTLQDALTLGGTRTLTLRSGTLNTGNFAISTGLFSSTGDFTRAIVAGTSNWTISGASWTVSGSNFSYSGTGTISMTSASPKTFAGAGFSYPTLNNGGAGALTISGSNNFANLTNTVQPTTFTFTSGTINTFNVFSVSGTAGNLVTLGATSTSQASLQKSSAWNVGLNSTDGGNNTGLSFIGSSPDYLSISYIRGVVSGPSPGNFLVFF
jgi:hypothetical protein